MATYFDPTNQADVSLVHPDVRAAKDLAFVAGEVEADVIHEYTKRTPSWLYTLRYTGLAGDEPFTTVNTALAINVYLRGYTVDANDPTVDPSLKAALKRAVAGVIGYRLMQRNVDPFTRSQSTGDSKSVTYRDDATALFPRGWERWLREFDTREAPWGM